AANSSKPIIIIIDEIDDLYNPKKRTGNEQYILAELMNQLQNCLGNPKVITIFTANSYELIEEKFTSRCHVIHWQAPNWQQRYDIIKYYTCIYPHTISDKDVETFASYTIGFVGRDIELAFENAFRIASSKNKNTFNTEILFEAFAAIRNKIDQCAPQSFISKILFLRRIQATFGY
ncbi:MAG TPA: AAA family ATPase, partial [Candidatus Babeliales bacterium]|nr:AAA family ATPase [Candidatus Babeliales bacterium]